MKRLLHSLVIGCFGATAGFAEPITIFAASSLKSVLDDIATDWGGDPLRISYGSSATMASQIVQGAPADVFLSAHTDWVDWLGRKGIPIENASVFAGNTLVVVGSATGLEQKISLDQLDIFLGEKGRLSVGLVDAVPAGIYAKQALQHIDLWETLQNRLAQSTNVRAAAQMVARGEAAVGIVYTTDGLNDDRLEILATFDAQSHDPISYVALVLSDTKPASDFVAYLRTEAAQAAFKSYGFAPPKDAQ